MKKDRSSNASSQPERYTLPKNKILRGRINFQRLFTDAATIYHSPNLSIRFRIYDADQSDCKLAFIVPKRLGKAVQRNRIKRRLKESYRQHQFTIMDEISTSSYTFHGALTAKSTELDFDTVEKEVTELLTRVQKYIHNSE